MFQDFKNDLQRALTLPLPGKEGQAPLKPYLQVNKSIDAPTLPNKRKGAVMSLIYPVNNIPHILFIERPIYDGVHSGQIAFPGGKIESSDPSNLAAALRETKEEIGIESNIIDVVGPLSSVYVLASNFIVYPFVGIINEAPKIIAEEQEVAGILEVPLYQFLEPNVIKEKPIKSAFGLTLMAPYYDIQGKVLWGATAMMVSELCAVLQRQQIYLK